MVVHLTELGYKINHSTSYDILYFNASKSNIKNFDDYKIISIVPIKTKVKKKVKSSFVAIPILYQAQLTVRELNSTIINP